jgi:hypothetical protein
MITPAYPPTAVDDPAVGYVSGRAASVVAAPGVLANDSDTYGSPLRVVGYTQRSACKALA